VQEKLPNLSTREAYIINKLVSNNSRLGFWTYFAIGLEVVRDNPVQRLTAVDFLRYSNAVRGKGPSVRKQNDICSISNSNLRLNTSAIT